MITISNVSKNYRGLLAVNDVSVQVGRGKIIGLVGPNGSGKSSLIKLILGLSRATSGSIIFADEQTTIGYLTELNTLPSGYKGADILKKLELLLGVERSESVRNLDELFGIKDFFTKKTKAFSKGMQKKLGLLIAFTGEPDLVILDEPFEGIDTIDRDKLSAFLRNYVAKGKTILLSTHILHELDSLCDEAHFLMKGNLVASVDIKKDSHDVNQTLDFTHIQSSVNSNEIVTSKTIADVYRRIYQ